MCNFYNNRKKIQIFIWWIPLYIYEYYKDCGRSALGLQIKRTRDKNIIIIKSLFFFLISNTVVSYTVCIIRKWCECCYDFDLSSTGGHYTTMGLSAKKKTYLYYIDNIFAPGCYNYYIGMLIVYW